MSTAPETVFITGATGFLGSSLAARVLHDGSRVIALARDDDGRQRTCAAIAKAAETLGLPPPETSPPWLVVVDAALADASEALTPELLAKVDSVWHLAATLAYGLSQLGRSLAVNLVGTADLYRILATRAPRCRRFYYVSTAYSAGFPAQGALVPEALHPYPRYPNAYQLSKWAAEMSLRNASLASPLPITILRPSIVVGHSTTGAYHGDPFGLYMFIHAGQMLRTMQNLRTLRLPPETNGTLNVIPIDVLVENAIRLARHEGPDQGRASFEVIHACGNLVSATAVARAAERVTGLRITFEAPRSAIDHLFAQGVEENRVFASHAFRFEQVRLAKLLGDEYVPTLVDDETLAHLVGAYIRRLEREHKDAGRRGTGRVPAILRPLLPVLAAPAGPMAVRLARIVKKRIQRPGARAA
jgi:nucleoside-diphosphate-sugar epimerase